MPCGPRLKRRYFGGVIPPRVEATKPAQDEDSGFGAVDIGGNDRPRVWAVTTPVNSNLVALIESPAVGVCDQAGGATASISGLIAVIVAGPKIVAKATSFASRPVAIRISSSTGDMRVASNITQRPPR